ncbi:MAG: tetratricopeptide repeat protein [Microcoleus sp. PH2017_29_MFU_D_A]|uniref:tetratricopeptide repeat protein n=1 Tax=unclassified Microcoleus TaxID=2642155 RepID=UPI001DCC0BD5|nr:MULTISPECIES: tetratricopeptide repeat protein [unclassified Microcoleus]MCC3465383.1 tetratricopeptide repeat protein [Microcoleus sp. PH2017_06_SFM_O_A]TAE14368.1 MAG: tetratricopeptide repeat protein [Oscillatoriales cyanobacterium]MCC3412692.1 tetratricopeptide repeat protein [Microcoleus sp. PH2017_02_FOX_O_A]MCC3450240.1 tetratricopeptide repeat protein [Microcoleus sp. PH2017_09_SFU_O_A]MCC3473930.1 tetratricopeptide repeat protein [Microcoleus sp. PH2017_13_LAR_U_A]
MKNDREFRPFKPFTWIGPSILVAGMWALGVVPPVQAESTTVQIAPNLQSQNLQPPRRGPAVREVLSYEMKGDELKICKQEGNSEKKCQVVGKGYTVGLRTANDLYGQGNIVNAEVLYRQLIARYPKQADAYYKLGSLLSGQGKMSDAIVQYQKAIEVNPQHAKAHNDLGVAMASQGKLPEAIVLWRQAVKINSQYPDALNNLGVGLYQQGAKEDQAEALASLKKAKELFIKQGRTQAATRVDKLLEEINSQSSGS